MAFGKEYNCKCALLIILSCLHIDLIKMHAEAQMIVKREIIFKRKKVNYRFLITVCSTGPSLLLTEV